MAESSRANHNRRRVPEHDIFLSHSGEEKAFVEQLFHDLIRAGKHPFFDQDRESLPKAEPFPQNIVDAAKQCKMGVVVVSEGFLTSYWPMVELSLFVEYRVGLFPLFFKLSPSHLKEQSKWEKAWRDMGMKEEVVESWGKAVKELRISNGLDFEKYSKSEYTYRQDVVKEICKQLPPIVKSKTSDIKGYERLCKTTLSMFGGNHYLGLYGMAGAGKSTLCKAMCNYSQDEFGADVYHIELTSDQAIEQHAGKERLTRLKQVLQRMGVDKGILKRVLIEEQGWELLNKTLRSKSRIFLAIDNVGNSRTSKEEARSYIEVGLPQGNKVLVTSRSREILEDVLGCREYCKPLPRLEEDEALKLFLAVAAPKRSLSSLNKEERKIVGRCVGEGQYKDSGYSGTQFHPLVLKALGSYFQAVDNIEVVNWDEALENSGKLQRSEDAKNVNFVLGLNYEPLSDEKKLIYLDTVLYPHDSYTLPPWWKHGTLYNKKWSGYDKWALWISEVHALPLSEAKKMLKELQRLSLLEDSQSWFDSWNKPHAHDLYKDFVRGLVASEGSMEWKWWMSQEEINVGSEGKLKRLVLEKDESLVGRLPRKLQQWRTLVYLELHACNGFGPILDLGGLKKLRVLVVKECAMVGRIICSCDDDKHNENLIKAKKDDHSWGCMRELCSITLERLYSLGDMSFLRHCPNIEILKVLYCNGSIYPSRNPQAMNISHLKKLHTLIMREESNNFDVDSFGKWLCNTLQLKNLGALEYVFHGNRYLYRALLTVGCPIARAKKMSQDVVTCSASTIYLNEGVSTSNLTVLSMCLPVKVEEVDGLQYLSNLTTLNLSGCEGLSRLPNLKNLNKLKEVCFGGDTYGVEKYQYLYNVLPEKTRRYIESLDHDFPDFCEGGLELFYSCVLCEPYMIKEVEGWADEDDLLRMELYNEYLRALYEGLLGS